MKKQHLTIGAVAMGVLAVLGIGAQTVYAVAYTTTQVSQHNTESDCWEIIDGKVYNLTAFISAHPGGRSAIVAQCGKDASAAFHNGPHGASAINAIASYQVGTHETAPITSTPAPATTPTPAPTTPTVNANSNGSTPLSTVSSKHDSHEDDDRDELKDEDNDEEEWEHHGGHEAEFEIELHSSTHLFGDHGRGGRDHGEDD